MSTFAGQFFEGVIYDLTRKELEEWNARWPHFSPSELSSYKGELKIFLPALDALQEIRRLYGRAMTINCAYRNPAHNKSAGGVRRSQHLLGTAFDIHITSQAMGDKIEKWARELGFTGIGRYNTFIHIDMRKRKANYRPAYWDARKAN